MNSWKSDANDNFLRKSDFRYDYENILNILIIFRDCVFIYHIT